ncbi:MAG TPA: EAL domain-containing protein [Spirochaetota bacterium]|nr:EAL domain-containing protein [Spirochaetota bacterium]HPS87309.1 EAL domain-containing protein [Spirochaetota bacterium]
MAKRNKQNNSVIKKSDDVILNDEKKINESCSEEDVLSKEVKKRKCVEEELKVTESRYRFISENMLDLVCLHDTRGIYQYVSHSVKELLGYEPSEMIGRSPLDFFHPDDIKFIKKNSYFPAVHDGNENLIQYRARKKDGSYIWFETLTRPIKDGKGKIIQLQTSSRDVSKRKEYEQKLIENEMMYRTHYKNFPLPSYTFTKAGDEFIFTDFNDAALKISDGKIPDYIGRKACDIFIDDPQVLEKIKFCYDGKTVITSEGSYNMITTGSYRSYVSSFVFVPPAMVTIHNEDVTEKKLREDEIRNLAKFPEDNPNPVFRVSINGEIIYSNPASSWLLEKWRFGETWSVPQFVYDTVKDVISLNETLSKEFSIDGRIFNFTVSPVSGMKEVYFYGFDITEKKIAEEELLLAGRVFETTTEGIVVTDSCNNIIRVNPAFTHITGYSNDEVVGRNPKILKSERHDRLFYEEMWKSLTDHGTWEGEIWNRRKNGETYPEWLSINVINDEANKVKNYVSVFRDISDIKSSEEKIEYQAYHDPLTGLPNRSLFSDRLSQAVNQAVRSENQMALLYIDLDRFKIVNDSLGHITGDYLLQEVAKRLSECVRDGDTVARVGGDEFIIILPNIEEINDVVRVCGRITEKFSKPLKIDEHELFASASIGISIYPDDGTSVAELHKNADIAMYHAKSLGGGEYQFFSVEMNSEVDVRLILEMQLRKAIEQDQFEIFFQPIVDSRTGTTVGVEALARWIHPELGVIPPSTFVPVAEETGYIVQINDIVLKKSCLRCVELIEAGYPSIYISVNITSHQFLNRRILESVSVALEESGLNPENLIIEITEDSIMQNVDEITLIMKELKQIGIRFSIDDFGTGYSSLSYLKKFPLDNLKIDRSFIVDIPGDSDSKTLARTIIVLAKELGLKIIAEGVENKEQIDFFTQNHEYLIQGYYYSKPVPFKEFLEFLKEETL